MRYLIPFLCLFFWLPIANQAQDSTRTQTWFESMYQGEMQSITIRTDMKKLIKNKRADIYQPATLSYVDPEGTPWVYEIQVRSRGNSRKVSCFFPPVKLKFVKDDLKAAGLKKSNKIKLVNQCRSSDSNAQLVYKEYLAYKLYNLISPYSFKVQLVEIIYVDSRGKKKPQTQYGFIIEPMKELAQRLEGREINRKSARWTHVASEPAREMAFFQYLIGNTDWYVHNMHNLKMMKVPAYPKPVLVPYDFDYAGFVDAPYAVPHESMPIKSVRDRWYMKEETDESAVHRQCDRYAELQASFKQCIEECEHLDSKIKRAALQYLEDFYHDLETDRRRKTAFRLSN